MTQNDQIGGRLPWGVHTVGQMFAGAEGPFAGLPDGRWVHAVCEPYYAPIRGAWWVLTGRAHAVVWPKPGDIERVLNRRALTPEAHHDS